MSDLTNYQVFLDNIHPLLNMTVKSKNYKNILIFVSKFVSKFYFSLKDYTNDKIKNLIYNTCLNLLKVIYIILLSDPDYTNLSIYINSIIISMENYNIYSEADSAVYDEEAYRAEFKLIIYDYYISYLDFIQQYTFLFEYEFKNSTSVTENYRNDINGYNLFLIRTKLQELLTSNENYEILLQNILENIFIYFELAYFNDTEFNTDLFDVYKSLDVVKDDTIVFQIFQMMTVRFIYFFRDQLESVKGITDEKYSLTDAPHDSSAESMAKSRSNYSQEIIRETIIRLNIDITYLNLIFKEILDNLQVSDEVKTLLKNHIQHIINYFNAEAASNTTSSFYMFLVTTNEAFKLIEYVFREKVNTEKVSTLAVVNNIQLLLNLIIDAKAKIAPYYDSEYTVVNWSLLQLNVNMFITCLSSFNYVQLSISETTKIRFYYENLVNIIKTQTESKINFARAVLDSMAFALGKKDISLSTNNDILKYNLLIMAFIYLNSSFYN